MSTSTTTKEYAFSGSLCRIQEFIPFDGYQRYYCLIIFSLSDYKHLHFPHYEYKCLMCKLHALQSTHAIMPPTHTSENNTTTIVQKSSNENFKIKFGNHNLIVKVQTSKICEYNFISNIETTR